MLMCPASPQPLKLGLRHKFTSHNTHTRCECPDNPMLKASAKMYHAACWEPNPV